MTRPDGSQFVIAEWLATINRFARLEGAERTDLLPDCWVFALEEGLHCFRYVHGEPARPIPLSDSEPVPHRARSLARRAIGDAYADMAESLIFDSYVEAASVSCATFFVRRVELPARELTTDWAYSGPRLFGAGFSCASQSGDTAWVWDPSRVNKSSRERFFDLWDVFRFEGRDHILVRSEEFNGECHYFEVYALGRGASELLSRIRLGCI